MYSEAGGAMTRRLWEAADGDQRAVLVGAAHSPACYAAMSGLPIPQRSEACGFHVILSWDHVAWHCEVDAPGRPLIPNNVMQRCMGWVPVGCGADKARVRC